MELEEFNILRSDNNVFLVLKVDYINNKIIVQYYLVNQGKKEVETWNLEETINNINNKKYVVYEFKKR